MMSCFAGTMTKDEKLSAVGKSSDDEVRQHRYYDIEEIDLIYVYLSSYKTF